MSKNTLDKLFGSRVRVKILKFMFRNNEVSSANTEEMFLAGILSAQELSKRIQEPLGDTKKELNFLEELGLIDKIK